MKTTTTGLLAALCLLASCSGNKNETNSNTGYRVAEGYFVRNDLGETGAFTEKITDSVRFNEIFGRGATLSTLPTTIDYSKEFVAAIVLPATHAETEIRIDSVVTSKVKTQVYYSVESGQLHSYTIRPNLVVLLDKKYDTGFETILNEHKQAEPEYTVLNIVNGKGQATVRKESGKMLLFSFDSGKYKKLTGKLTAADPQANIRFSQIFMPDGSADGPFGREIQYDITPNSTYKLSVGENMMAGDPWSGEFKIEISLK